MYHPDKKEKKQVKLYIESDVWLKIKYYITECKDEISMLGQCDFTDGNLSVTSVELFKQVVGPGSTTMDEDALVKFLFEKTKQKQDVSKYNVWIHSHASMQCFWSHTDESTISAQQNKYLISIVLNHKMEYLARLDMKKPPVSIELDLEISISESTRLKEACIREINQKVKKEIWQPKTFWNNRKEKKDKVGFSDYPGYPSRFKGIDGYWDAALGKWIEEPSVEDYWDHRANQALGRGQREMP